MDPRVAEILARGKLPTQQPVEEPAPGAGMDWIVQRKLHANPKQESDIQRICNLPIASPLTDEEIDAVNEMHVKPSALEAGFRLERVQAEAIQAFVEEGSVFAPVEVGGGKTLISLRCTGIAFEEGLHRVVLFVPSQVYAQLVNHDIAWCRRRVPLGCSFHLLGGKRPSKRRAMAGGRRGCWVMPYSLLSVQDSYDLLEAIRPDLLIFDEAHALKNRGSARTQRVMTYWRKYRPRVVALSGTMTSKSLKDYAHLLNMCLGPKAPIPVETQTVDEWASVLDSEQATEGFHAKSTATGPLRPLINWSNKNFPQTPLAFDVAGFRRAFQNRLLTAPGVVSSPPGTLGTSIVIENLKALPPGEELKKLTQQLNDMWVTPNGDELEHAMLVWKWKSEFTAGFYNNLIWPEVPRLAERLDISAAAAESLLARSKEHHAAQQMYHKELRQWFRARPHRPGMDTPMLVGASMARNGAEQVGPALYDAWRAMKDLDFPERIQRDSIPVRVDDYKLMRALEWAERHPLGEGIIWYYHQEIGVWLAELMAQAGMPVVHCPAGKASNEFLTSDGAAERCKGKFLVASVTAHGIGKNLQFMSDQLFVQLPPTEQQAQQSIGRTHRKGQEADEVTITTMVSNETDELALAALLNDAMYVFETMHSQRKLLIASWNPMPTIYGSSMLIRAGIQARILNARQQQLLGDRFQQPEKEEEET